MTVAALAVLATEEREAAQRLAASLALPLVETMEQCHHCLEYADQGLQLRSCEPPAPGPVRVDFIAGALDWRRRHSHGRKQPLPRAVGIKPGVTPRVVDATAGLGRDGFLLAALGCEVTLLERVPAIAALLEDGLQRASADPEVGAWLTSRLQLISADAIAWLGALDDGQRPDTVYLDPMYPQRGKSALVKKEMRLFRQIAGDDPDSGELLAAARNAALRRVVVKRPLHGELLAGVAPSFALRSVNTRFDIYLGEGGG